jgi:hypothetical protein
MKQKNEKKISGMCHGGNLQENKKNKIDAKKQRNPEPLESSKMGSVESTRKEIGSSNE